MAYNEFLADRIRNIMTPQKAHVEEKKMMGGLTFMYKGKMCCGVIKDHLVVRVVEDKYKEVLNQPHCREMDFTGRPMKGFVYVDAEGIETDESLSNWIDLGVEFVDTKV